MLGRVAVIALLLTALCTVALSGATEPAYAAAQELNPAVPVEEPANSANTGDLSGQLSIGPIIFFTGGGIILIMAAYYLLRGRKERRAEELAAADQAQEEVSES